VGGVLAGVGGGNMPAEVAQFDDVSVGIEKQVLRFDVSVAHTHLVNISEGARNWRGWRERGSEGEDGGEVGRGDDAAYLGTCKA